MVLNLKRLRAERIACGITQDEMAHMMGWKTRTPYAKRENGIVDIGANEFIKMAKILGYETNNLDIFLLIVFPKKNNKQIKGANKMKSLKIQYGVPEASKIKSAVNEIEEAIENLNYDAIDIEIGIAPKPIIEFDEEEE